MSDFEKRYRQADHKEPWYAPEFIVDWTMGFIYILVASLIFAAMFLLAFTLKARAEESFRIGERANVSLCRGWIKLDCSCSHRACWEARPGEFESIGDGKWKENSSGQVKMQTGWSRDGIFVACAWRTGLEPGVQYHVGKGAPLSCVYPPLPAF